MRQSVATTQTVNSLGRLLFAVEEVLPVSHHCPDITVSDVLLFDRLIPRSIFCWGRDETMSF
jgi:hypothetical protein